MSLPAMLYLPAAQKSGRQDGTWLGEFEAGRDAPFSPTGRKGYVLALTPETFGSQTRFVAIHIDVEYHGR
jgi:hypothetical protein